MPPPLQNSPALPATSPVHVAAQSRASASPVLSTPRSQIDRPNFSRHSSPTMVSLFIGQQRGILKAAFESSFIEGLTQTYTIEDVRPDIFQLLVQWIYTKNFDGLLTAHDARVPVLAEVPVGSPVFAHQRYFTHLWTLADRLAIQALQNTAMKGLVRHHEKYDLIGTSTFRLVYENPAKGSPLRQRCIDAACERNNSDLKKMGSYPKKLLGGMAMELINDRFESGSNCYRFVPSDYFIQEGE
ncbi:hypothetical protein BJ875DRAFT_480259 [Amylocarpus encephaloides]|uniref:BTB domain-containing protein n=1 Tax=Amylocarpus encephaloides TaxID=45428 RepID=A0A9P7YT43_9HELO|nr:hypothetical protein BJ875DRAFT_480259 [Amylocarpus encephaloides]